MGTRVVTGRATTGMVCLSAQIGSTRPPERTRASLPVRGRAAEPRPLVEARKNWKRIWSFIESNALVFAVLGALLLVTMAVLGHPQGVVLAP